MTKVSVPNNIAPSSKVVARTDAATQKESAPASSSVSTSLNDISVFENNSDLGTGPRIDAVPVVRPTGFEGRKFDQLIARLGLTEAVADGVVTRSEAETLGYAFEPFIAAAATRSSPQALDRYSELLGIVQGPKTLTAADLLNPTQRADYLVIAPTEFHAALAPLLAQRQVGGHQVALVDPAEIYRAVGSSGPEAIGEFVRRARETWAEPKLRFLVLAGRTDRIPTFAENPRSLGMRANPSEPFFASDYRYSLPGESGASTVAVGRLPFSSAGEVGSYVTQVIRHEAEREPGMWQDRATFLAGDPLFGRLVQKIEVPFENAQLHHATTPRAEVFRSSANPESPIFTPDNLAANLIAPDPLFISYMGHGMKSAVQGLTVLGLQTWQPANAVPLVTMTACLTGRFQETEKSLAEELIGTHALTSIGASAETLPHTNIALGSALFIEGVSGDARTVGETLIDAEHRFLKNDVGWLAAAAHWAGTPDEYSETGARQDLTVGSALRSFGHGKADDRAQLAMHNLFGDPGLEFRRPQQLTGLRIDQHLTAGQPFSLDVNLPPTMTTGMAQVFVEKRFGDTKVPFESIAGLGPQARIEAQARNARRFNDRVVHVESIAVENGKLVNTPRLPANIANGGYNVRIVVIGSEDVAVGASAVRVGPVPAPHGR